MSKIEVDAIDKQSGSTLTIGGSGTTVQLGTGASQTGFGRTGTVDWQTGSIKTATFTAANGEGYFANTSGGAFTMNLPAGTAGNIVSVVDYTNTFQTHALTVAPNGSQKIGGVAATRALSTEGQSVTFVYVDDTEGWKNIQDSTSNITGKQFITATGGTTADCGDFRTHTFTGPGTFCVSALATCSADNVVDYLVVAGGGAGGSRAPGNANAGGGGGGFRYSATTYTSPSCAPAHPVRSTTGITVTASAFPITVGAGGAGVAPSAPGGTRGNTGANSVFSTIISAGGGGGGGGDGSNPTTPGANGGSGGGSGGGVPGGSPGGTGNTPPVSPSQGNPGGRGGATVPDQAAGGGGGAMSPGIDATPGGSGQGEGGNGGGLPTAFGSNGTPVGDFRYYAAGGGAGNSPNYSTGAAAGTGGTGFGSGCPEPLGNPAPTSQAKSGAANTGHGGGGAGAGAGHPFNSGGGGSGIVVIRYKFQ